MITELRTESGAPLHPIGIGTYPMGSWQDLESETHEIYPDYEHDDENVAALAHSLWRGQNFVDTAELYGHGHTEELVGRALRESGVNRKDVFVTSKLWKESVAPDNVRPAVVAMLGRLGTSWIDLLYIHTTKHGTPWREGLPAMNELVGEGLVRHIGVSEFNLKQLREAEHISDHPIAALQFEYNIGHPQAITRALRRHCETRNITMVAYSPLGKGEGLSHPEVRGVAFRHGATPAQVALAWCMRQNTLPIPKAVNPRHVDDNLGAMDLRLTRDDMQQLRI